MTVKVRKFSHTLGGMLLIASLAGSACGNDDASAFTSGSGTTTTDREAAKVVQAQIDQRWLKGPDGWTTQVRPAERAEAGWPSQREPLVLFEQYHDLKFSINPRLVSDTEHLNGVDYAALVEFENSPRRLFRRIPDEFAFGGPRGWSPWEDGSLAFENVWIDRKNGEWRLGTGGGLGLNLGQLAESVKPDASSVPPGK